MKLVDGHILTKTDLPIDLVKELLTDVEISSSEEIKVPFTYDHAYKLNSIGIPCTSPMGLFYNYPAGYGIRPYQHQREGAEFLAVNRRAYLLAEPGTGKTMTAAWAMDYLLNCEKTIKKVLIVAPKSTLISAWGSDLSRNLKHIAWVNLAVEKQKRKYAMQSKRPVHLINHDGVALFWEDLVKNNYDLIIYDESTAVKNPKSQRHQGLRNLILSAGGSLRVWMLTGTPIAQSPEDGYGQVALMKNVNDKAQLCPPYRISGTRFMSLTRWRDITMDSKSRGKHLPPKRAPKDNAEQVVKEYMKPAFVRRLRDCADIPEEIQLPVHEISYSPAQKKALQALKREGLAQHGSAQITITAATAFLSKMLQIGCGIAYTDPDFVPLPGEEGGDIDGRAYIEFDTKAKDAELLELINQAEGKAIVYVPFTAALKKVSKFLKKEGLKVVEIYGNLGAQALANRIEDFQSDSPTSAQVIVAQPYKMSHGITATAASMTVWYGPILRGETYQQANKRMARIGQKRVQTIAKLAHVGSEVERFNQLDDKTARQEAFLDLYKKFMKEPLQ